MRMFFSKGSPVISCAIKLLLRLRTSRAGNASHMAPTSCQEKTVSTFIFQDNKMFYALSYKVTDTSYYKLILCIIYHYITLQLQIVPYIIVPESSFPQFLDFLVASCAALQGKFHMARTAEMPRNVFVV